MSATRWDVIVVGSGPAGQKAAICAAKAGKRVLVIEQEVGVGGACVHRGTVPSKTLRETALAITSFRRRSGHVIEIDMPESLQVASLLSRMDEVVVAHERFIDDQLARNHVELWRGRARFLSAHEVEVVGVHRDVRLATAELVVVATGSRPRTPPGIPIDHEHVLDSDSVLSMRYLPKSLIVLGSGVIASEYASIFAALGVKVTMVDRAERPLAFLDPEMSMRFLEAFERMGGTFIGGARAADVQFDGLCMVEVKLENGTVMESEKVLVALGRVANVEELDIGAAGLAVSEAGVIPVDATCATKVPGIYAVGDVIGPPSLASTAMEQGRRAICHALGLPAGASTDVSPIGVYTIPEISQVGLTEDQAKLRLGGAVVGRARFDELTRGQIAGAKDGLLKLVCDPTGRRIVGVHIIGEGAAELVHTGQMAILGGLEVDVFVENTFNFPTLAEGYRVAALEIVGKRPKSAGDREQIALSSMRRRVA
jgi:NAD(P) transhydrogenase